jgi:hypothetical protein
VQPGRARTAYVFVNFVLLVAGAFSLVMWGADLPLAPRIVAVALVLLSLATLGGLLEIRRWATPLEVARWVAVVGVTAWVVLGRPVA